MSSPVVLRPEASQDAETTRDYYELQLSGLGQAFLGQLNDVLQRITDTPQIYAPVWNDVRAARLRRFTYVVYYRIRKDRIEVLAVVHGSRDTTAWKSRV
ncbi:MAG: type II toxin-antitoxin system RelE/ParE family toxin [Pirellulaceae bacterium]